MRRRRSELTYTRSGSQLRVTADAHDQRVQIPDEASQLVEADDVHQGVAVDGIDQRPARPLRPRMRVAMRVQLAEIPSARGTIVHVLPDGQVLVRVDGYPHIKRLLRPDDVEPLR